MVSLYFCIVLFFRTKNLYYICSKVKKYSVMRIYVDMDNVLCDYAKHAYELGLSQPDAQYVEGFYRHLEPIKDAIESFIYLTEKYDEVYILSCGCWDNPTSFTDKVLWIDEFLPIAKNKLILSARKDFCEGDYLIDDRAAHGASEFKGKWLQFGSEKFPDWKTIVDYIDNN